MKAIVSLSIALALSAAAQTAPPDKPAPVKIDLGSSSPTSGVKADAKPAAKKDDKKKKEEAPARIDGVTVARGAGFLGIQIVDGHFKVSFYDAKKKPLPPDVASAVLRWKVNYQPDLEHTQLTPGGGANSLTSEKVIRQPYSFKLTLLLLKSDGDDASTETLQVDFQQ
jgi:hypothetical protein